MKNLILTLTFSVATVTSSFADVPYGRISDYQDTNNTNPLLGTLIFFAIIFICAAKSARDEKHSSNK